MGGWLSVLAAIERPTRVCGIVGVATACDFLTRKEDYLTPEVRIWFSQLSVIGKACTTWICKCKPLTIIKTESL